MAESVAASEAELKACADKAKQHGTACVLPEGQQNFEIEAERPEGKRGCTDIFCLILFICMWIVMIGIAMTGFLFGDPRILTSGYDSNGNICGATAGFEKYPNLYYPFPYPPTSPSLMPTSPVATKTAKNDKLDLTWSVCVEKCPNQLNDKSNNGGAVDTKDSVFSPPNMCSMPFKVRSNYKDQRIITCGGLARGRTDMSQFGTTGFFGFRQYCMTQMPKCKCSADDMITNNISIAGQDGWLNSKVECCTPQYVLSAGGEVGSQTWYDPITKKNGNPGVSGVSGVTGNPDTQGVNASGGNVELSQFGIPFGYKYGFCFVPYPSYLPGEDTNQGWTRCVPRFQSNDNPNATAAYQEMLGRAAGDMAAQDPNFKSSPIDPKMMEQAVGAVITAMSGPQQTVSWLIQQLWTWKWIIAANVAIALGISFIFTFLLRFIAGPLIYFLMFGLLISSIGFTTILGFKAGFLKPDALPGISSALTTTLPEGVTLGVSAQNQNMVIAGAVASGIFTSIYIVLFCVMLPRVWLALKIMNLGSQCLQSQPLMLVAPLLTFIFQMIVTVYFLIVCYYLASSGKFDKDQRRYVYEDGLQHAMIVHLFGYLWTNAWYVAMFQLTVAGTASQWFLSDEKDKTLRTQFVVPAYKRTIRCHIGTAAFGSFIIACVQLIRLAFRYYMWQLSKLGDPNTNQLVKFFAMIGECVLWCLEQFIKFINKNAYIQCAIRGVSFWKGALDGTNLLIRNCLRVGTLNIITTIFCYIGRFFICISTGVISALWISSVEAGGDISKGMTNVMSAPVFPVLVIVVMAWYIACSFLDVWDMSIDTIFQCYCMDEEYAEAHGGGGFFGYKKKTPTGMQDVMDSKPPPSANDIKTLENVIIGSQKQAEK